MYIPQDSNAKFYIPAVAMELPCYLAAENGGGEGRRGNPVPYGIKSYCTEKWVSLIAGLLITGIGS